MKKHQNSLMRLRGAVVVIAALLALLPSACRKDPVAVGDKTFQFTATTERLANATGDESKVYLYDERMIVWEYDDSISIGSNMTTLGNEHCRAWLYYSNGRGEDWSSYNGVFLTSLPEGSRYFLGLHPCSNSNIIQSTGSYNFNAQISLPARQTYRNDSTFDKQVFPMVAWYGGNWDESPYTSFNLDFHSLAAIVRIQLFNSTGEVATLNSITFTDTTNQQLVGAFNVNDYNTNNPYLTAAANSEENRSVTLDFSGEAPTFNANSLVTFYLVLPAIAGRESTTTYNLRMTVNSTVNSVAKSCIKNIEVPTRRNGLTNMQALSIDSWATKPSNTGLSGCGTTTRPFKVYRIKDLQYLRDCYNSVERRINGQPITRDTYIKIMRSDIVMTDANWDAGIRNFVGHLSYAGTTSHPGIVDSCYNVPLFESISEDGVVEGLSLKCGAYFNSSPTMGASPFCTENRGTIRDCVLTSIPNKNKYTISTYADLAGICVANYGTIEGCRFEGKAEVQTNKNFAGICLHNLSGGIIKGCQMTSNEVRVTSKATGICYENASGATVRDCYFSAKINNSTANWAGIVYDNSGTVEHCYFSSTGQIYTSKSVGGIVRNNLAGKVDYCWLDGPLQGRSVGGIVDSLVDGTVINSFNGNNAMITAKTSTGVGGGLVGYMKGGNIKNSYVCYIFLNKEDAVNGIVGGIVGKATGGSADNCYNNEDYHLFYGTSSGATYTHCHIVDGSQTGVPSITETLATAASGTSGCLIDDLNGNIPSGGKTWVKNGDFPELTGYSISPAKRRR